MSFNNALLPDAYVPVYFPGGVSRLGSFYLTGVSVTVTAPQAVAWLAPAAGYGIRRYRLNRNALLGSAMPQNEVYEVAYVSENI